MHAVPYDSRDQFIYDRDLLLSFRGRDGTFETQNPRHEPGDATHPGRHARTRALIPSADLPRPGITRSAMPRRIGYQCRYSNRKARLRPLSRPRVENPAWALLRCAPCLGPRVRP